MFLIPLRKLLSERDVEYKKGGTEKKEKDRKSGRGEWGGKKKRTWEREGGEDRNRKDGESRGVKILRGR